MNNHEMAGTPVIGNVYVLNAAVAQVFYDKKIPGIVVNSELRDLCMKQAGSPDKGKAFFYEFAAKQAAIYRGLGYRGIYLGGAYNFDAIQQIIELEKSFGKDDWKLFAKEIRFSVPGEFFYYGEQEDTGLADPDQINLDPKKRKSKHVTAAYYFSRWTHSVMFTPGKPLNNLGTAITRRSKDTYQGPALMRTVEKVSKSVLFGCEDCGDCSLPNISFLCPEHACAKNQRNGPCGGTKEGMCEVDGIGECIWLKAYERLKSSGEHQKLLDHAPMVQNQGLRRTSAWANNWLGRDHATNLRAEGSTARHLAGKIRKDNG
jgi:methylenetetrahydrofolate reductase (NADPH)